MKLLQKMFAVMLVVGLALCAATACASQEETLSAEQRVYRQALELGYEGSLEEFIQQVTGKDGKDGASVSAAFLNEDGELIVELSDGNSVNVGRVKGESGENGKDGKDGVSVSDAFLNEYGELIVVLSDGNSVNVGQVKGEGGENGKDGSVWHCGEGIPASALGRENDFYLDTLTYDIYVKSSDWIKEGNIRGDNALQGSVTVEYDAAEGAFENGESRRVETLSQGDYALLPVPVRENHLFAGWYFGEGASASKFSPFVPVFQDLTLTAKWMPQPQINYLTPNVQHSNEGEALPEGVVEVVDLYGVYFAECTVNGSPAGDNISYTVLEKSFGKWTISVNSLSAMAIGNYAVTVTLYAEYTTLSVSFRYSVTAAPVHGFGEIVVDGREIADKTLELFAGDSYELSLRLASSYSDIVNKICVDEKQYALSEGSGNVFEEAEYTLIAVVTYEESGVKIDVSLYFSETGEFDFSVVSEADNGIRAVADLHFIVS